MDRVVKKHEGGCQCGFVRFRTTDRPVRVLACHCHTCKQRTGGAYGIGVYFNHDDVEFLTGDCQEFTFRSSESGRWLRNAFCPKCGSSIAWILELRPGLYGIAGGNYDYPDWFEIEAHIWVESARPDMRYADEVETHEKALSA